MSAMGSVGISTGITTGDLPAAGNWALILLMWAGRLELLWAFALLWLPFARQSKTAEA